MIKFFRKIRQQMLTENKVSKYLVYAIGEIVLVVIGILIALQINNWNESRKSRVVEIELLKTIKTDLDRTLIDLKDDYEYHLESQKYGNRFKRFLLGEKMLEDSIFLHFSYLSQDRHFFPNSVGYESFKTSEMNIISNDTLRLEIAELYELTFPRIKEWDESNPRWDISMALHPYVNKHFIITDQLVENQISYSRYPEYKLILKSLDEIRNDNGLQIDLQETFQIRRRKINLNLTGIERIESVLSDINNELEKLISDN
ncbi:DUF6090 family protein [Algoriphagus sp. SE2]|uniref:DUF6090 family protein n=1 Tax=Algoriphagus sp. SE2 TaxID=3141536 RepID=UPI0031CD4825